MDPMVRQIPLAGLHRELGAKFGPFAGYDMPIQYPAGLKAEHLHTRSHNSRPGSSRSCYFTRGPT